MVVFLDLDDPDVIPGACEGQFPDTNLPHKPIRQAVEEPVKGEDVQVHALNTETERPNPNLNAVTASLGCYPIIINITHQIDLNTLHALSRTCRQVRHNLLQYRHHLIQSTLRCRNESAGTTATTSNTPSAARVPTPPRWHLLGDAGHLVSGKVSTCARDLVSDCRRCGAIVCRNCAAKPPSLSHLPNRLRRLCSTCLATSLDDLTAAREPCQCASEEGVHLCAPCGTKLATADTQYGRIWTWRTRFTTRNGGLGTGIGEGNQGVKCARGRECEGGEEVEVEFECSSSGSDGSGDFITDGDTFLRVATPGTPGADREKDETAGYWRQEIEGLGGVVKKKFRKRERVGRTVRVWDEEREGGDILAREKLGKERSWCGWCGRVVASSGDRQKIIHEKIP